MQTRTNRYSSSFAVLTIIAIAAAMSIGFFLPNIVAIVAGETVDEMDSESMLIQVPSVPAAVTFTAVPETATPTFTHTPVPPTRTLTSTFLPTTQPTSTSTPVRTHLIQPGETLSEISDRYEVSIEDLIELNSIDDADRLLVGEEIQLPP